MKIKDTDLSTRTKNALQRNGVFTTEDMRETLVGGRLDRLNGIGRVGAREVRDWFDRQRQEVEL